MYACDSVEDSARRMTSPQSKAPSCHFLGRYVITETIASGGMASIHLGRLVGAEGFVRTVAIKRLLPKLAKKGSEYATMFLDEARIAARIQHPNVAQTLDAVSEGGEFFIVMEYVHGETLVYFLKKMSLGGRRLPLGVVGAVFSGMLQGLHAAHEATDEDGAPLNIIHRDISPQNVMVGVDGIARLLDFGVAKGEGRQHQTQEGQIKGKLMYMSPEQLRGKPLTRTTDLFSAGALIWEALVGEPLFNAEDEVELLSKLLTQEIRPPSQLVAEVTPGMDAVVMKALERDPHARFATAAEMAAAVEGAFPVATQREVGAWVAQVAARRLSKRSAWMTEIERVSSEVHRKQGAGTLVFGSLPELPPDSMPRVDLDTGDSGPHVPVPAEPQIATTLRPATPEDLVPTAPPAPNQDLVPTAPPKGPGGSTMMGLGGRGGTIPISAAEMGEIEAVAARLAAGGSAIPELPDLEIGPTSAPEAPPKSTAKGTVMMFDEPLASVPDLALAAPAPAPTPASAPMVPAMAPLPAVTPAPAGRGAPGSAPTPIEVEPVPPSIRPSPMGRAHAGAGNVGMVDHSMHPPRRAGRFKLPITLFSIAVLITVGDVALTRMSGVVLELGPVRPSAVAGILATVALVLAGIALARPRD